MPWSIRVRPRHQVDVRCVVGRRCIHLLTVDDILVAVAHRAALEPRQVRSRLGLSEPEGENDLSVDQPRNELLLLLFGAGRQNGRRPASSSSHSDSDPGEFLFDHVLFDSAAALSPVFLGPADADPVALRDLPDQFSVVNTAPAFFGGLQLP